MCCVVISLFTKLKYIYALDNGYYNITFVTKFFEN